MRTTSRVVFLDRASLKANVRKLSFAAEYVEHDATGIDDIVPRLAGAALMRKVRDAGYLGARAAGGGSTAGLSAGSAAGARPGAAAS